MMKSFSDSHDFQKVNSIYIPTQDTYCDKLFQYCWYYCCCIRCCNT